MTPEKVLFGVSLYFTDNSFSPVSGRMQRFIGSAVKDELAGLGKKANFIGYSVGRKQAQLTHVEVFKEESSGKPSRSAFLHRQDRIMDCHNHSSAQPI